ncbi:hypothetical protein RB620_05510 [Paenibacillus sp. LHD-117]|uniref:hypothetical protein n=1 Tax=Paenibacillus sp. LHD-117 TaxID=3071412 RepID=UPI0027DF0EFF|nr:hypothetical protein [Paenibacillus sp. LHD-117]MDQ6418894.1 hypothetical protein [Paenibacillus sp. LHD-117]
MKKTKLPGDNISLKTKKNENPLVMSWLNSQTNLMDSLRYLVEKEISSNGVRNLQAIIPAARGELHNSLSELQDSTAARESTMARLLSEAGANDATMARQLSEAGASDAAIQAALIAARQLAVAAEAAALEAASEAEAAAEEEEVDEEDIEAWS